MNLIPRNLRKINQTIFLLFRVLEKINKFALINKSKIRLLRHKLFVQLHQEIELLMNLKLN